MTPQVKNNMPLYVQSKLNENSEEDDSEQGTDYQEDSSLNANEGQTEDQSMMIDLWKKLQDLLRIQTQEEI